MLRVQGNIPGQRKAWEGAEKRQIEIVVCLKTRNGNNGHGPGVLMGMGGADAGEMNKGCSLKVPCATQMYSDFI